MKNMKKLCQPRMTRSEKCKIIQHHFVPLDPAILPPPTIKSCINNISRCSLGNPSNINSINQKFNADRL